MSSAEKVRLIFWGGSREKKSDGTPNKHGISDNDAFYHAALNVQKTYKDFSKTGQLIKFTTGKDCVEAINKQVNGTIHTLDLLCHGTLFSLNLSQKENENCGITTGWAAKVAIDAYYIATEGKKYSSSSEARYITDIEFTKFSVDARIEIHGCNGAKDMGWNALDTLSELMSKKLFEAGRADAVVVGHLDKANPSINGAKTTIKEQDYRHGHRAIFHQGKKVQTITEKGAISYDTIRKAIGK